MIAFQKLSRQFLTPVRRMEPWFQEVPSQDSRGLVFLGSLGAWLKRESGVLNSSGPGPEGSRCGR